MQVRAAYKGHALRNEALPLVSEFLDRKKLAKLGYVFDARELTYDKAEAFLIISDEFQRVENEEARKKNPRKG